MEFVKGAEKATDNKAKAVDSDLISQYETEISKLQQEIRDLVSAVDSKDQAAEQLRQQLNRFLPLNRDNLVLSDIRLEGEIRARSQIEAPVPEPELSKEKILKAAETTIQSLRELLQQKDSALSRYRY